MIKVRVRVAYLDTALLCTLLRRAFFRLWRSGFRVRVTVSVRVRAFTFGAIA